MKLNYKLSTILGLPMILAACAGGGDIKEPEVFVSLPTATAVSESNVKTNDSSMATVSTNGGEVLRRSDDTDKFVYKTPDGKYYAFGSTNTMIRPVYSSPSKEFGTKQYMQSTDNGGKLFGCCTDGTIDARATYVKSSYYGAWLDSSNNVSLFSGGVLANVNEMQGGVDSMGKGKATYDVIGIRVKNGTLVNSSYRPYDSSNKDLAEIVSRLTVNFNTGKLGGEIIGNSDFGDSIIMKDVSVSGNTFSGSATSGSATGAVNGAFYGTTPSYKSTADSKHSGSEIGGIVKFSDTSLNAAFGGARSAIDTQTQSTDLTPLTNSENQ